MRRRLTPRAFTLTELCVVLSVIALLTPIFLPTRARLRISDDQAACLANLRQIAQASNTYAAEDPRYQLDPIQRLKVLTHHADGFTGGWSWRTALPRVFGGATPTVAMPTAEGDITVMMDEDGPWAGSQRPLNPYVPGADPLVFQCPADTGALPDPVPRL